MRRFNFFEYGKAQESALFRALEPRIKRNAELNTRAPMQMKNNPEVTVRSRGVMEKCSFCVQRIIAAKLRASTEGRATIVFLTELDEAFEIADRILVMSEHTVVGDHRNEQIDLALLMAQVSGTAEQTKEPA